MTSLSRELIEALPKTDLHLHLDGSLRIPTLIDLARSRRVELPSYTEQGLRELVFKDAYQNLPEYLEGFRYTVGVMQDEEALEQVAFELAEDNQREGVRYIEVRFAPQLHVNPKLTMEGVLGAVDRGLARAKQAFNARPEVARGEEPEFEYGIIVCALRFFTHAFSSGYADFFRAFSYAPDDQVFASASLELARAAVRLRDELPAQIVGFDLAGQEHGYPAQDHREAYQYVHEHFLGKTVHAGEDYGPESIFQAITDLHADRLGHGTWLFDEDRISDEDVTSKVDYVSRLAQYIADRRITIEVCLTSNQQTIPELADLTKHPFAKMREARLSTTLCTDNRLVSQTTVTDEILKAVTTFGVDRTELKHLMIYGFKRSFYPGSYREKRGYVRKIIDYTQAVMKRLDDGAGAGV